MSARPGTVVFDGVSKRYRLGSVGTLRGAISDLGARLRKGHDAGRDKLWALRDVSFRVEPGESLGLIGPNGAGKTTALKLLANITQPTSGSIAVHGRASSLIELGAGFHPELTGRENIYLNGAILGLRRREIERKMDAIVAFSELEKFLDTPVKRYSSGMYVRLGFSVAAHVEPDVLLVDEVLAVGDASFRQKCIDRMNNLRRQGATLLFVSHNMYLVRRLCTSALLLTSGEVQYFGATDTAISEYENLLAPLSGQPSLVDGGLSVETGSALVICNVSVTSESGQTVSRMKHSEDAVVRVTYRARRAVHNPIVKVRLIHSDGSVAAMVASRHKPGTTWDFTGQGTITARFRPIQLATGIYYIEVRIIDTTDTQVLASGQSAPFHAVGPSLAHELDRGLYVPNVEWDHATGECVS